MLIGRREIIKKMLITDFIIMSIVIISSVYSGLVYPDIIKHLPKIATAITILFVYVANMMIKRTGETK